MNEFLKINIQPLPKANILERIHKYIRKPYAFFHIVSINPENVMIAQGDEKFREILSESDIQIVDGIGIALGGSFLGIEVGERVTGVDLMEMMLENEKEEGLHILLLGGKSNVADTLAKCYQKKYPSNTFKGMTGISNIRSPKSEEENEILSIVADYKPQIIYAAFGSPWQENWFWDHRDKLKGIVCMGVGGGFDFVSGKIQRAPRWVRDIGLEWLFRLLQEPWRIKRQLRLVSYFFLLIRAKIGLADK